MCQSNWWCHQCMTNLWEDEKNSGKCTNTVNSDCTVSPNISNVHIKRQEFPQTNQKPNLFCSSYEIVYTLEKFKLFPVNTGQKSIDFINSNSACVACGNSQWELFCLVILHNEDLSYIWVVNLAQTCLVFI